jgi:hypothetical protein
MTGRDNFDDRAWWRRGIEPDRRELPGATDTGRFEQDAMEATDLRIEVRAKRLRTLLPQPAGTILHHLMRQLRHARGRRAGPRREWEDMHMGELAFLDQAEGAAEHDLGLGREPRYDVAPENNVRTQPAYAIAEAHGIGAPMAPLHSLQDHIVTGLQ